MTGRRVQRSYVTMAAKEPNETNIIVVHAKDACLCAWESLDNYTVTANMVS